MAPCLSGRTGVPGAAGCACWLGADVPCMRTGQAAAGIRLFGDKVLKKERQLCCFCATYLQEEL